MASGVSWCDGGIFGDGTVVSGRRGGRACVELGQCVVLIAASIVLIVDRVCMWSPGPLVLGQSLVR